MRIGAVYEPGPNAHYRAIYPLQAMERRGHRVVWLQDPTAEDAIRKLAGCDVVHVYRHPYAIRAYEELRSAGTPIVYDNDDDFTAVPRKSRSFREAGGLTLQRYFGMTIKVAQLAQVCTTTTAHLAAKFQRAGVERVEVIGNYLAHDLVRPSIAHPGVVIGWIAGREHEPDVAALKLREALQRLMEKHAEVRVESIGVHLGLGDRYRHDRILTFGHLPRRIGGFDIGIAPLADTPFNRARSDIKVKEYAASGVPWLASPVGSYAGLGEREGGRLVPDDGWFEALDRLVSSQRERRRLARRAKKWARKQTIEQSAAEWERLFREIAAA